MINRLITMICSLILLIGICNPGIAAIWYVDYINGNDSTTGRDGRGRSWENAYKHISRAMQSVSYDGKNFDQIWVKNGINQIISPIRINKKVIIYGGFNGNETMASQRNWDINVTTLNSILGNRCLIIEGPETIVTIDGFTITRSGDYPGGGIKIIDGSAKIAHCKFIDNDVLEYDPANYYGGAIHTDVDQADQAKILIESSSFYGNKAFDGGAISINKTKATLRFCTFFGNTSIIGGAIHSQSSEFTITNCTFEDNQSNLKGGAIYNSSALKCEISGSEFINNQSLYSDGGAIYCKNVVNRTFIKESVFEENRAAKGGGLAFYNSDFRIEGSKFEGNVVSGDGGAIWCSDLSPISGELQYIKESIFKNNSSNGDGGAIWNNSLNLLLFDNFFGGNTSNGKGGAILCGYYSMIDPNRVRKIDFFNCVFTNNSAQYTGGAIYLDGYYIVGVNSTFYKNNSDPLGGSGGAIFIEDYSQSVPSGSAIGNCIFSENYPDDGSGIIYHNAYPPTVIYCAVQGGYPGEGNITNPTPLFVDAENDDFHLSPDSPCVDVGSSTSDLVIYATDFDGGPRIVNSTVDIGADEYSSDQDGDGLPNYMEYGAISCTSPYIFDTDGDGLSDGTEYWSCVLGNSCTNPCDADTDDDGLVDGNAGSEDLNGNGIYEPLLGETDPIDPDSDDDGLPDGLERGLTAPETLDTVIAAGNFIKDEDPSTLTDPTNPDTDGDGVYDGVEDSNQNGRLDIGETNSGTYIHYLDIKPEDCPNYFNLAAKGILPAVILGSVGFDVSQIDPTTVLLEGVAPKKIKIEDVTRPHNCNDSYPEAPDLIPDLALKFDAQKIGQTFGDVIDGDEINLKVTANLLDGTPIQFFDKVVVKDK